MYVAIFSCEKTHKIRGFFGRVIKPGEDCIKKTLRPLNRTRAWRWGRLSLSLSQRSLAVAGGSAAVGMPTVAAATVPRGP